MSPTDSLVRRQYVGGITDNGGWYYSETAFIIKWVVAALIVVGILAYLIIGYLHAQRRMKKGLPPLRYHQFLIPHNQRARFFPPNRRTVYHQTPYGHGQAVPLNQYGPPPPAYGENDYVPPYAPPEGSSKINPDQHYEQTHVGSSTAQNVYPGPSHPPPAASGYR